MLPVCSASATFAAHKCTVASFGDATCASHSKSLAAHWFLSLKTAAIRSGPQGSAAAPAGRQAGLCSSLKPRCMPWRPGGDTCDTARVVQIAGHTAPQCPPLSEHQPLHIGFRKQTCVLMVVRGPTFGLHIDPKSVSGPMCNAVRLPTLLLIACLAPAGRRSDGHLCRRVCAGLSVWGLAR